MKILVTKNKEEASQKAFKLLQTDIINGAQVLGLATGSSPLGLYQKMTNSPVDYSNLISINLDEYVGLKPTDPQSYHYFMEHHLFTQKPFAKSFIPDGSNLNATKVINHYNQILATYPIDTQILGIGNNGHIGFNEPGTPFDSQTHKVKLTPATINANARFFTSSKDVPTEAYTMGIGSILQAKHIILLAFGEQKADAINKMVNGKITTAVPASVLQKHPNVTVILDKQAASKLA
ncbi:glucosamine-6-phosphate deaminase [Limosilactobacillus reuteri]|uniref:Glucosamine-6-phosphate deaminase n=1 Tax=Limosilactobacillus reuteri TaxID=1598 RepID=A0A1V4FLA7_LIMRT|nr:glucosamine-6-phosphate deaminase [Limosilactobacillus reuteri]MCC4485805.1 glucosamine-6-phosphate deaminase [Limosilactobacillus reuteri]MDY5593070.1 glucosamine-6-phosphate deaminase [Limosilactobacillus reuteri]OJI11548.1 glucosamine-6-phosphate deaminase [Limosilactobacillus reuteri]OPG88411.1 glucosamine-6-phosphate deaminase [Limosilactobacillus reuteri]